MTNRRLVLWTLMLGRFALAYQSQFIAVLGPNLRSQFDLSEMGLGLLLGSFMLPGVAVAVRWPRTLSLLAPVTLSAGGTALLAAGGLVSALAQGPTVFLCGRLVSGTGAAVLNVSAVTAISRLWAGEDLRKPMSGLSTAMIFGAALSLTVTVAVGQTWGWNTTLWVACFPALLSVVLLCTLVPRSQSPATVQQPLKNSSSQPDRRPPILVGIARVGTVGGHGVLVGFLPVVLTAQEATTSIGLYAVGVVSWAVLVAVPVSGSMASYFNLGNRAFQWVVLATAGSTAALVVAPTSLPLLLMVGVGTGYIFGLFFSIVDHHFADTGKEQGLALMFGLSNLGQALVFPVAGYLQAVVPQHVGAVAFSALLFAVAIVALRLAETVSQSSADLIPGETS